MDRVHKSSQSGAEESLSISRCQSRSEWCRDVINGGNSSRGCLYNAWWWRSNLAPRLFGIEGFWGRNGIRKGTSINQKPACLSCHITVSRADTFSQGYNNDSSIALSIHSNATETAWVRNLICCNALAESTHEKGHSVMYVNLSQSFSSCDGDTSSSEYRRLRTELVRFRIMRYQECRHATCISFDER